MHTVKRMSGDNSLQAHLRPENYIENLSHRRVCSRPLCCHRICAGKAAANNWFEASTRHQGRHRSAALPDRFSDLHVLTNGSRRALVGAA
jgi:hypothetical protein